MDDELLILTNLLLYIASQKLKKRRRNLDKEDEKRNEM